MLSFEEKVKIYKRFLKENGVYKRVIEIHCNGTYYDRKKRKFPTCLEHFGILTWIQNSNCFCTWYYTKEGDLFWYALSVLWQMHCYITESCDLKNENKIYIITNFLNRLNNDFFDYYKTISEENKELVKNIYEKIKSDKIKLKEKLKEYEKREEFESPF